MSRSALGVLLPSLLSFLSLLALLTSGCGGAQDRPPAQSGERRAPAAPATSGAPNERATSLAASPSSAPRAATPPGPAFVAAAAPTPQPEPAASNGAEPHRYRSAPEAPDAPPEASHSEEVELAAAAPDAAAPEVRPRKALSRRELESIKRAMIQASIDEYAGSCPCPYNTARNGSRCGRRSAYHRAGGASPLCFPSDITDDMAREFAEAQER